MMNMTPQSMRSPVSPYHQQSKQSFSTQRPWYPSTPQPESTTAGPNHNRGLGLSGCSLSQSQSNVHAMPPSPQPSGSWSQSPMMDQDFSQSNQPPDIFTAAYDPFANFHAASNTAMMSEHTPEAPGLVFSQSPPSSNLPSHRSSVSSSYSPSEAFSQHESDCMFTPKVKVEDPSEWYPSPGNEPVLQRSVANQGLSPYPHGVSPVNPPQDYIYRQNDNWKPSASAYPIELHNADDLRSKYEAAPIIPSAITRIKKKRQRTTPEEATHECRVCGKLFKRSYNWKSHMETHNPERKYPHPCTAMVGNVPCTKKFQRKTDLDRHHDSVGAFLDITSIGTNFRSQVHLKARNHRCTLCGNRFARRDTLRRLVFCGRTFIIPC